MGVWPRAAHGLPVGVAGVAAHRRGVVADPALVFAELRAAGMCLSDSVVANALRMATGSK